MKRDTAFMAGYGLLLVLLLLLAVIAEREVKIKILRADCKMVNATLGTIRYCHAKPISRNVYEVSVRISTLPPAWERMKLNLEVYKRYHIVYRPYVLNYTVDLCEFMQRYNHPFGKLVLHLMDNTTNINHTCPYQGDLVIEKFRPNADRIGLPLPLGEYQVHARMAVERQDHYYQAFNVQMNFEIFEVHNKTV